MNIGAFYVLAPSIVAVLPPTIQVELSIIPQDTTNRTNEGYRRERDEIY